MIFNLKLNLGYFMKNKIIILLLLIISPLSIDAAKGSGAGGFFWHNYQKKLKINEKKDSSLQGPGGGGYGFLSERFALGGELFVSPISIGKEKENLSEEDTSTHKENKINYEYNGSISIIGLTMDYALLKFNSFQILPGTIIGVGNYSLTRKKIETKDSTTTSTEHDFKRWKNLLSLHLV